MNIPADEDDNEETYGDFLERTGIEDTEQHYQMFISGGYTDDDYE
jgi:ABC-type histidine transport system ATPase subunit